MSHTSNRKWVKFVIEGSFISDLQCWRKREAYFFPKLNLAKRWQVSIISGSLYCNNELAEAVESWRGASGGASLPDDLRRQKAWDLPIIKENWDNMLLKIVADQVSIVRLMATAQKESGSFLNALPLSSLGTLLDSGSLGWPSPFELKLFFLYSSLLLLRWEDGQ